jgi:cytoskeletal protein CcmA (bactofilin family)
MQFKKGATERHVPEIEQHESNMETDITSRGAEESRSPFSFSRSSSQADPRRTEPQPEEPVRASAPSVESVVDAGAVVEGHFRAANDLRLQGTISGEITCEGTLTVERQATARARISAYGADIFGTVEGDIVCSGRLRIAETAVISGTIRVGSLVVEEGATISGSVEAHVDGELASSHAASRPKARKESETEDTADKSVEPAAQAESGNGRRTSRTREAPSFALVSSEESVSTGTRSEGRS